MMRFLAALATTLGPSLVAAHGSTVQSRDSYAGKSVFVSLESYYNNKAFGLSPGEAAFNALNESYPDPRFALSNGTYTSKQSGIVYNFPGYRGPGNLDNLICKGQTVPVATAPYFSASMLVSADVELEAVSGNVTYTYSDDSTTVSELRSLPWWAFLTINRGEVIFPYRYTANGTNFNSSHIFEYTAALDPGKTLRSVTLPSTTNATTGRLHLFAMSLWAGSSAQIQAVRPTQKWMGDGTQVVEITVNNAGSECIVGRGLTISVEMPGVKTVQPGIIKRLCPGDQKRVDVGVTGTANSTLTVLLDDGWLIQRHKFPDVQLGLTEWTPVGESLAKHESPRWFDDAKYGIFIHWGPYSVPAWGNSTPWESYAEWFWWYSTHRAADKSDIFDYRLRTFGPSWNYDDGFQNFTASKFNPKAWVDLISDAGAKYFVLTTKHHDGFALFDTSSSSHRNALQYGPKRDLVRELFDAAAMYHPQIRRGTYFSLPEWFNPDFGPYGFAQLPGNASTSWPGIIARNPYTGLDEPYTGRLPISDFITDLMIPQMEALAYNYSTDIMWCDCGAANDTATFAASWWNHAQSQNRQVTINSRCGIPQVADFDTPEYATFSSAQRRKWETNEGMDPYSFGYNRATSSSLYMNATTIIHYLVDIVSKNGNFLLDIGPRADGTITEVEVTNLRQAGKWIHAHEEAIFNTTYWFVMTELSSDNIRFTQTDSAFYILMLEKPAAEKIYIDAPIPILEDDTVTAVGVGDGSPLKWKKDPSGSGVIIYVPLTLLDQEEYCWVLKVTYHA